MTIILPCAQELERVLAPACDRIEIAGSIRRGKPDPKDVELLVIPRLVEISATDLFGNLERLGQHSVLDTALAELYFDGAYALDRDLPRNGPKYKRLRHQASGTCIDLFITTPEGWGVQFVIRTGPADFSKALVTRARELRWHVTGGRLHKHAIESAAARNGNVVDVPCQKGDACPLVVATPDEESFLVALGLRYIEPAERDMGRYHSELRRTRKVAGQ